MLNRRTILAGLATLPWLNFESLADASKKTAAFKVGEKLTYSLGWQFITVGKATIEVLPDEIMNERPVRSFRMRARTHSVVDKIFKVRDDLSSLAEYNVSRSEGYSKIQREGKTKRDISVEFDWNTLQAHYHEARNDSRKITPIQPNTLDPLSAFYYVRNQPFTVGTKIKGPLTDGKKCKEAEIKVVGRERIKVEGKTYNTLKLVPDLKEVGGVFEKDKKARLYIWVTDDHRHIPVQLKSKVAVGSFVAQLVKAENI